MTKKRGIRPCRVQFLSNKTNNFIRITNVLFHKRTSANAFIASEVTKYLLFRLKRAFVTACFLQHYICLCGTISNCSCARLLIVQPHAYKSYNKAIRLTTKHQPLSLPFAACFPDELRLILRPQRVPTLSFQTEHPSAPPASVRPASKAKAWRAGHTTLLP